MKSRKNAVSAVTLLVMILVTFFFAGCENGNGGGDDSTTDVGGGVTIYKGLSDDNNKTIEFKDYTTERTYPTLSFTTVKSGSKDLPFLSKEAIKARFNDTKATRLESLAIKGTLATLQNTNFGEQNLSKLPSYVQPYFVGEPKKDIMDLALARYNFIRRLAGLSEATYNEQFHIEAQHAAWLCAMYNKTDPSHSITAYQRPEGVTDEMWNLAATGLSQCLYLRPHAANSVDIYMGDNGNATLGHRNNLLNLHTTQVGFGVASANLVGKDKNDINVIAANSGATAFRFNWNKQPEYKDFDYDVVSWPPAGYFPAKTALFDSGVDKSRWSVYFNTTKYQLQTTEADGKKTNVIVTKKVNGQVQRTWNFADLTANNNDARGKITYGNTTIFYLEYVDTDGKTKNETFEDGHVYTVKFENLKDTSTGNFTDLEYSVEFFDMSTVQ